ncbi:MAG: SNF2-related protein, partial [Planctomycetota bacterium]|nr:SNF2-related protein [Planctomycetota bacterium]
WRSLGVLVELALEVELDGETAPLVPGLARLLADPGFPHRPRGRERRDATWVVPLDEERETELPLAWLRALLERLAELLPEHRPDGTLLIHRSALPELRDLDFLGGERAPPARAPRAPPLPARFLALLRPYQRVGVDWLRERSAHGFGAVLADDMGLGKTLQVLALIAGEREADPGFRTLVVVPTSLLGHWQEEARRFAPELRLLVLHGPQRASRFAEIARHDLVLTTYPLLARDREALAGERFGLLVLD